MTPKVAEVARWIVFYAGLMGLPAPPVIEGRVPGFYAQTVFDGLGPTIVLDPKMLGGASAEGIAVHEMCHVRLSHWNPVVQASLGVTEENAQERFHRKDFKECVRVYAKKARLRMRRSTREPEEAQFHILPQSARTIKEPNPMNENEARLVEALRSGRYRQGCKALRPEDNTYCCLGVACDVLTPENWNLKNDFWLSDGADSMLPWNVQRALGWATDHGRLDFVGRDGTELSLLDLNDDGFTFDEIADVIEAGLVKHYEETS